MRNVIHRNCPYCGQDNMDSISTDFGNQDWPIKACHACGFVYMEIAPVYERLSEEFAWEKTSVAETNRRISQEPIKQFLSKHMKTFRRHWLRRDKLPWLIRRYIAAGNVLDVGCAGGGLLSNLDQIHIPHGIEISQALALHAQEQTKPRGGYVVHDDALSGARSFPADYFSGVILSAFLEHEISPLVLLGQVYRTLVPGGRCIIKVPNFASLNRVVRGKKWCGFRLPDHVNYFTPTSLAGMCKKNGFHVERFTITDRLPTSDNMWIVIQKPIHSANNDALR